jgi:hypothetical protein
MARFDVHIKKALLDETRIAVLTGMRKRALVLLQMIVHSRLILCRVIAVGTDELAILILLILKHHFKLQVGLLLYGRRGGFNFSCLDKANL